LVDFKIITHYLHRMHGMTTLRDHSIENTSLVISEANDDIVDLSKRYRQDSIELPEVLTNVSKAVKLLSTNEVTEMMASGSTKTCQDCILLYVPHSDLGTDLSNITPKYMRALFDIKCIRQCLQEEFGEEISNDELFVSIELGEAGLHDLGESGDYVVIDMQTIKSKRDRNDKLTEEITKLSDLIRTLSSEKKLLEWTQRLLELQCVDASEESKDWQQLHLTTHLKRVGNGRIVSEEKALTNSIDKLTIADGIHSSQLLRFRREAKRLTCMINAKVTENDLLSEQINIIKQNMDKSKKDYNEATEPRSKEIVQKDKMLQLMKRRRLANQVQSQEKEIAELRSQLKKLRCRTYPSFDFK
ncbi:hypothetical protein ACHAW6_012440, partial [Cyclotella cf. meneghiniana]